MCYACGKKITSRERIGFRDTCPDCGLALHVCRNCRFFKPGAHWDCAETVSELVPDKEKANFCEWFSLSPEAGKGLAKSSSDSARAKSSFDDLFKP